MDYAAKKKKDGVIRVLVVDDNRDNALTLGVLLRSEGYIVHMAKDGAEALRLAEAYRPDMALLDLRMPDCPVLIAITGHDAAQAQEEAGAKGFHRFMAKPYDPDALVRLIASFDETH